MSYNSKYKGAEVEAALDLANSALQKHQDISGKLDKTEASITYATKTELDKKVDAVSGKGLSTNDYTTTEKNKLAGIAANAEVNVQSDWNVTSTSSDAYIKNKPVIPTKTSQLDNDSGFIGSNGDGGYLYEIREIHGVTIGNYKRWKLAHGGSNNTLFFQIATGDGLSRNGNVSFCGYNNDYLTLATFKALNSEFLGNINVTGTITQESDETLKNVKGNVSLSVEEIAQAPFVKFTWKDREDGTHVGTIAQYWQDIVPDAVHADKDGYLSIEYNTLALGASVITAREVVKLKEEIAQLKEVIEEMRSKLS